MITRKQVQELRKAISTNRYDGEGYDKIVYEVTDNLLDTLEALYKVAEAAGKAHEDYVCWTYGCPGDVGSYPVPCDHNPKYSQKTLGEALAALEEKK